MGNKPNISIRTIADLKRGGLLIGLRKGINELRCKREKRRKGGKVFGSDEVSLITVIICTMKDSPSLKRAVASILKQKISKYKMEIIVVINDSLEKVQLPDGIKVFREEKRGISYSRNAGAKNAEGDILIYIDDDAVADENMVENIADAFKKDKRVAIVGGQIFLETPTPKPEIILEGKEGLWSQYVVPFKKYRRIKEQYEFPYGACFGIRRESLFELGGFPENYGRVGEDFQGGEETAICFLAQKKGWEIGVQPKAYVKHCVNPERFNKVHIKKTIMAGIETSYRLSKEGYSAWKWDERYIEERCRIAKKEKEKLKAKGSTVEIYYKECEEESFKAVLTKIRNDKN